MKVNAVKKNSGWMLAAILIALAVFADWFGGDYFRFNVLLAALATLTLWVSLVVLVSWSSASAVPSPDWSARTIENRPRLTKD